MGPGECVTEGQGQGEGEGEGEVGETSTPTKVVLQESMHCASCRCLRMSSSKTVLKDGMKDGMKDDTKDDTLPSTSLKVDAEIEIGQKVQLQSQLAQRRLKALQNLPTSVVQLISTLLPEIAIAGYKFLTQMASLHKSEKLSDLQQLYPTAAMSERYVLY